MQTRAILGLCVISVLWGSDWIFAPLAAEVASPFAAQALAAAAASCMLGALWLAMRVATRGRRQQIPLRSTLLLAFALPALPWCLMLFAASHGLGGWALLLAALMPLLVALADQSWNPPMIVAVGAVLVLFDSTTAFTVHALAWALVGLAAVAIQAYGLRLGSGLLRGFGWRALTGSLALQLAVAAGLLACGSLLFDHAPRLAPLGQWTVNALIGLGWLAVVALPVAYLLLYRLLALGSLLPVQVAAGQWVQILVAVVESAFLLHARPSWRMAAALVALVVCTGMLLRKNGDDAPPSIVLQDTSA